MIDVVAPAIDTNARHLDVGPSLREIATRKAAAAIGIGLTATNPERLQQECCQ